MPQSHYHWNDREHDVTIGFELCMNIKNLVGYVANFLAARWVRSCAWYPSRTAQFIIFVMVGLRDVRHTVGVEDVGIETWPEGDNHLVALIWRIFFAFRFIHWACSFVLCLFPFLAPKNAVVSHARSEVDKKKLTITLDHGCRHVPRLFLNESVGIDKRGQVITTVPCTIDDHYVVTQLYFLFGS